VAVPIVITFEKLSQIYTFDKRYMDCYKSWDLHLDDRDLTLRWLQVRVPTICNNLQYWHVKI